MRVTWCGVRGSTPAPGRAFTRTGGHTSCLAIAHDDGPPVLLLDAGTGVRAVTALLGGAAFRGTVVLSHLHWDHVQGLPFFAAADRDDAVTRVLVPPDDVPPFESIEGIMQPPYFPVHPNQLQGRWTFEEAHTEQMVEGFRVVTREVPHSSATTLGIRVEDPDGGSLAYLPDHAPHLLGDGPSGYGELHDAALELAAGVDVLVHDSHFVPSELARFPHFGHSCAEYAVSLAKAAGAGRLVMFHHHPDRTDDEVDRLVASLDGCCGVPVVAAVEGVEFQL